MQIPFGESSHPFCSDSIKPFLDTGASFIGFLSGSKTGSCLAIKHYCLDAFWEPSKRSLFLSKCKKNLHPMTLHNLTSSYLLYRNKAPWESKSIRSILKGKVEYDTTTCMVIHPSVLILRRGYQSSTILIWEWRRERENTLTSPNIHIQMDRERFKMDEGFFSLFFK